MNFKVFLLFPLLFLGCMKTTQTPNWYHNLPKKSFEIIGFGQGENEIEAKENARKDIAEQISIFVKSESEKIQKQSQNSFKTSFQSISIQKSKVVLSNLEIAKISKDGKFVAMKYVNLPFENRFLKRLKNWSCGKDNFFLQNSRLGKLAISHRNCLPQIFLSKNRDNIFINSGEVSENMANLTPLFFEKSSKNLNIQIPKEVKAGEGFELSLISLKKGFLNIFILSEVGEVVTVVKNYKIEKNREFSTEKFLGQEFYSWVQTEKEFEKTVFVVTLTNKSLDIDFQKIREKEAKYKFFEFSRFLELFKNKFEFSSKVITILQNAEKD